MQSRRSFEFIRTGDSGEGRLLPSAQPVIRESATARPGGGS